MALVWVSTPIRQEKTMTLRRAFFTGYPPLMAPEVRTGSRRSFIGRTARIVAKNLEQK
jgi:hypothetical protein